MLQTGFLAYVLPISLVFIFLGLFAMGWLIVHVEYSRHYSWFKITSALVIGSIFLGFGFHFLLIYLGL